MMVPPLLRYFWFHSIYSLAALCSLQSAVCGLQSANVIHRLMEPSADEVGLIPPVFSPKLAGKICLVDGLVIDLLTRRNLY